MNEDIFLKQNPGGPSKPLRDPRELAGHSRTLHCCAGSCFTDPFTSTKSLKPVLSGQDIVGPGSPASMDSLTCADVSDRNKKHLLMLPKITVCACIQKLQQMLQGSCDKLCV